MDRIANGHKDDCSSKSDRILERLIRRRAHLRVLRLYLRPSGSSGNRDPHRLPTLRVQDIRPSSQFAGTSASPLLSRRSHSGMFALQSNTSLAPVDASRRESLQSVPLPSRRAYGHLSSGIRCVDQPEGFHGNYPNHSDRLRRMLAIAYRPAWAGPIGEVEERDPQQVAQLPEQVQPFFRSLNTRTIDFDVPNRPDNMQSEAKGIAPSRWQAGKKYDP